MNKTIYVIVDEDEEYVFFNYCDLEEFINDGFVSPDAEIIEASQIKQFKINLGFTLVEEK